MEKIPADLNRFLDQNICWQFRVLLNHVFHLSTSEQPDNNIPVCEYDGGKMNFFFFNRSTEFSFRLPGDYVTALPSFIFIVL